MNSFVTFCSKILSLFMSVICAFNIVTPNNHKTNDHKSTSSEKVYFEEFEEEAPNNDIELVEDETPAPAEESKAPAAEEAVSEETNEASASGDISNTVADNGERNLDAALPVIDNDTNGLDNLEVIDTIDISEAQNNSVTMTLYAKPEAPALSTNTLNDVIIVTDSGFGYNKARDAENSDVIAFITGDGKMQDNVYNHFVDMNRFFYVTTTLLAEAYGLNSCDDIEYVTEEGTNMKDLIEVDMATTYYTKVDSDAGPAGTEIFITDEIRDALDPSEMLKISPTELIIDDGITTVSNGAFFFCADIVSVELPDSVETIGENAFAYCSNLTKINLNKVKNIERGAFMNCASLKDVYLPATIETIEEDAFSFIAEDSTIHCPTEKARKLAKGYYVITPGRTAIEMIENNIE